MHKIIFTGPESSGKTTMSNWFADQIGATYVPEFARLYLEKLERSYDFKDLELIAKGQLELIKAANGSGKRLVCDTGMLVLKIWAELKFDSVINFVDDYIIEDLDSIYVLCKPDIPWEEDPLRENEHDRDKLFVRYEQLLQNLGLKYWVLQGSLEERKKFLLGLNLPE
jgi:nicotinamide riboside kinase